MGMAENMLDTTLNNIIINVLAATRSYHYIEFTTVPHSCLLQLLWYMDLIAW